MTYVETIEPRLTKPRPATPADAAEVLVEWCRDLEEEFTARLRLVSQEDLTWQPHPDSNSPGVTVWHVARWIDIMGTRVFTGRPARDDLWHSQGWCEATGYEPEGLGYRGLGALTGYTPEQMRAVPAMDASTLSSYLSQATPLLIEQIALLGTDLLTPRGTKHFSAFHSIGHTLQGSFGHVGEFDTLVALRGRLERG